MENMSVTVTGNAYIVRGDVPLSEMKIVHDDAGYRLEKIRDLEHGETYALCRCGRTSDAPFCDGTSHKRFKGKETADRRPFEERCDVHEGAGLSLKDDMRCSLSRLCHMKDGTVWKLLPRSDEPAVRDEILEGCRQCPSGRLTPVGPDGDISFDEAPAIWIVQDPGNRVSSGICVVGGIPVISADGTVYESRGRQMLCRCGVSGNRPFCDSSHINNMFNDERRRK